MWVGQWDSVYPLRFGRSGSSCDVSQCAQMPETLAEERSASAMVLFCFLRIFIDVVCCQLYIPCKTNMFLIQKVSLQAKELEFLKPNKLTQKTGCSFWTWSWAAFIFFSRSFWALPSEILKTDAKVFWAFSASVALASISATSDTKKKTGLCQKQNSLSAFGPAFQMHPDR